MIHPPSSIFSVSFILYNPPQYNPFSIQHPLSHSPSLHPFYLLLHSSMESQLFHVLAVDDSIIDRKLIEKLLKTSSFQVTAVDSPNKALELLGLSGNENNETGIEVNMIITDYSMPGMTGYELMRKIKESERLRDIPVVIMSSENIPSRISRCLSEGAEDFFLKPVQLSDVNKLKPYLLRCLNKECCKFQNRLLDWYPGSTKMFQSCV